MTKLHFIKADTSSHVELQYADGGIRAGFPSPAQDYITDSIDLNQWLIRQSETTFYARVEGDSMEGAGILNGDIIVIDKGLDAKDGDIVAAFVDGEFTLKRFELDSSRRCAYLKAANPKYPTFTVNADNDFRIWGVAIGVVRKLS